MSAPIIIIGSGMAGYATAREYRKLDTETAIIMITSDDGDSYSKPMLSTGYTKGKSADELVMASAASMSEQLNVSIRTKTLVDSIDTEKQHIHIGEEVIAYSKLVLATGASVNRLPMLDIGDPRVCSINDLDDYRQFQKQAAGKKRIAIIGSGLIGCEYANDLLNGGYEVHLVGLEPRVLDRLLPEQASECVGQALQKAGVHLHLERSIQNLMVDEQSATLTLDDGETINADVVISAIGLRPNVALAQNAGIETNHGIVCNRSLETSAPNVYALGDCAEVDGHVLLYVLPMMACARALAQTLNGNITQVSYGVMPVVVKTPACPVVVQPATETGGSWEIESDGYTCKALIKSSDGKLLGFALTGDAIKEKQVLAKQVVGIHSAS